MLFIAVAVGATISKLPEVIVAEPHVNVIVAPLTAAVLVAVKSANVLVPLTPATVVVPPSVHVPAPTEATTFAVLVVAFPY